LFVSKSYTAYSKAEAQKIEHQLLKTGFSFFKQDEFHYYYKDNIGRVACIYLKYKKKEK